ncbi:MAG: oligosaccharide flippase family protein [Gemmiger sp.]|uniref:oligosaccharide flippase family protein n=1 Tax=Gemmiger sp. TaxID=2049027 RepID=UPI002E79ED10|nr:oligosaccharide flippase family protein [Gemmiger sp.]MEE0708360.1 oligosaccharide flippase family protein [Gemmiger sp.]
MRTKRTLINMAYALGSSLLLLLLGLVTRRLLVYNFGTQISTASQVVTQLFNFFSIAEFGVGSVISYRLYEQIAAKNVEKISKYMSMYKWAYRAVGLAIAVLALLGAAALPWIMPDVPLSTGYTVYGLNVISTLCSYFLVTRRLMYTCTQQGYLCTRIDFCFNVLTSLAKIAVSLWLPNYVLYFSVSIVCNVCANLVVARRFRKDFPYVHDVKVTFRDFKELGIFHDLRYYLVHRLSNTIYGSSDTIVTSRMGGSVQTTLLGNYTNISTSATDLGNKVMDSFAAAIGNIVYDKTAAANDHDKQVFWGMDLFSYLFASFVATAYFCLFQPFMAAWMGDDWLLPMGFVLVFCLNEYVGWNHRMLGSYRAVLGHFEQDQWFMVASATVNLALSFALFPRFDVTGALIATVVAHCIMWAGRILVVFRQYMRGSMGHYLRMQGLHLVTLALCMGSTWAVCEAVPLQGWLGLIPRAVIVCILPNLLNLAVYGWGSDAAYLRGYAARILRARRNRS